MRIIVRVRELRKNHNLTQEELAKQLNISRQSLISLEQGRWLPSLPLAIQLAEFFRAPLEDVIQTAAAENAKSPDKEATDSGRAKEVLPPRGLNPWSPFQDFRDVREQIDHALDQTARFPMGMTTAFPTVNIHQDDHHIYIEAHVPGFNQEQIDIDVADDYVTISGTTKEERRDEGRVIGYLRREYQVQSFSRTIGLPIPVISDTATADMRNGVLTITLHKIEEEQPKTKRIKPTGE